MQKLFLKIFIFMNIYKLFENCMLKKHYDHHP